MQLQDIVYSQGFGTRRLCAGLVQRQLVRVRPAGQVDWINCHEAASEWDPAGLWLEVQGQAWAVHLPAYLMLHKPAGFECSHKPRHHASVYSLLPGPLRCRPSSGAVAGVQAVGRLDADTTGLLLFSDDGAFIHRMASPRHHVPKVYEVQLAEAIGQAQIDRLLAGVVLDDDPRPVRAVACVAPQPQHLRLTLTEGKYHQVKRMVAAVGHKVTALHRSQMGALRLDAELAAGQWRWLTPGEVRALQQGSATTQAGDSTQTAQSTSLHGAPHA